MNRFPPVGTDVIAKLHQYYSQWSGWKGLHLVLANKNIKDDHLLYCASQCIRHGDHLGLWLCKRLLLLSKTQRLRLCYMRIRP